MEGEEDEEDESRKDEDERLEHHHQQQRGEGEHVNADDDDVAEELSSIDEDEDDHGHLAQQWLAGRLVSPITGQAPTFGAPLPAARTARGASSASAGGKHKSRKKRNRPEADC